jgi:hypothetical protein
MLLGNGAFCMTDHFGEVQDDDGLAVVADGTGHVFFGGGFRVGIDFGQGVHVALNRTKDAFLTKIDARSP